MIYAAPGATFTATLANAPTGLVGTVGVRILKTDGSTAVARSTAGIIEAPAGSGTYIAVLVAPAATAGYVVFWDNGTVSPSTTADEELLVTNTAPTNAPPTGSELCVLADVRLLMQKKESDKVQDPLILTEIIRVSAEVMEFCERQFAPVEVNVTKTFSWDRRGALVSFAPWDLQSLTNPATSMVADTDNATPYVLTAEEYRLWPYSKQNGVYQGAKVLPFSASYGSIVWPVRQLQVTGTWGFPAIPQAVVDATAMTVCARITGNTAVFRRPEDAPSQAYPTKGLPSEAIQLLQRYKRVGF